jgi:hypothetical protein
MWISKDEYRRLTQRDRTLSDLESKASLLPRGIESETKEHKEILEKCAYLLGYEKKKKLWIEPVLSVIDQSTLSIKQIGEREVTETAIEFIKRLISEDEENVRLIKLAEEVEKGIKLKGKHK